MKKKQKKPYEELELEIVFFEESFIRTSFGNDGNEDENWDDEFTSQP